MTVSWDDTAALENAPNEVLDLLLGWVVANLLLHVEDEAENLLVGETVERTSQASKTGGVSEEWIGEGGSDEMDGVGRDISSLVVGYTRTWQSVSVSQAP